MYIPRHLFLAFSLLMFLLLAAIAMVSGRALADDPPSYNLYMPLTANNPAEGVLLPYAAGLQQTTALTNAGDSRIFVAVRQGQIKIIDPGGQVRPTPFLDLTGQVETANWEQGLLGLAFHPDYPNNGYLFVYYSAVSAGPAYQAPSRLVRYQVKPDDPNAADPASAVTILEIEQVAGIHKGGALQFGPDGYLYVATGESGNWNLAQSGSSLRGKLLRLDVNVDVIGGPPYRIPRDNPFIANDSMRDEIWTLGLRNPWRFSIDRLTGEMYIADVGENSFEEINILPAGIGGQNLGWNCFEGLEPTGLVPGCQSLGPYTSPSLTYSHNLGRCAVVGGYVYRGRAFPELWGHYYYADFCSGTIWSSPDQAAGHRRAQPRADYAHNWTTFGEDSSGELYIAEFGRNGQVFRILPGD